MQRFLVASAILFAFCQALQLHENRPNAIPNLSRQINNLAGGWSKKKVTDQVVQYANSQISNLEQNQPPGSPRHKLIKVKESIAQVVSGANYKIVFTVGQLNESALQLDDNRPDAIPSLSTQINNLDGGWSKREVNDQDPADRFVQYAQSQISKLEENKPPGSPRHKLIKIKEAISQVVAGSNYKIVFTVGQLNESPPREQINEQGQYGKCYFKLHKPLPGRGEVQLTEHTCVKVPKSDAV